MLLGSGLHPVYLQKPARDSINFWGDLMQIIRPKLESVIIATLGGEPAIDTPYSVEFAPLELRPRKMEFNYFLRTMVFAGIFPWLQKILRKHEIDVIHLIHNFGPGQVILSRIKAAKSIFHYHYDARVPFYDKLLKLSLSSFDAVIAGSGSVSQRLRRADVSSRIVSIPYGVPHRPPERLGRERTRTSVGLARNSKIVLWSGFIATVAGRKEFHLSYQIAKQLIKAQTDIEFVFAFKGNHARGYEQYESERIKIMSFQSRANFHEILRISTVLFSPSLNERAVVAAPLTWLESMAQGVPVVTTNIPGVNELISDEDNGIILTDTKQASEILGRLIHDPEKVRKLALKAKETIRSRYRIEQAAAAYMTLWSSLIHK